MNPKINPMHHHPGTLPQESDPIIPGRPAPGANPPDEEYLPAGVILGPAELRSANRAVFHDRFSA